jgi:hypothetical protein
MRLFPGKPLSALLKGYWRYMGEGLDTPESDSDSEEVEVVDNVEEEDLFDTIKVSFHPLPHRAMTYIRFLC